MSGVPKCDLVSPASSLTFIIASPELHAAISFISTLASAIWLYSHNYGFFTSLIVTVIGLSFTQHIARGGRSFYIDDALKIIEKHNKSARTQKITAPLLIDQIAVVTGGSSGIGFGVVHTLLNLGIFVIIAVRNVEKMKNAIKNDIEKNKEKSGFYNRQYNTHYFIVECNLDDINALYNTFYPQLKSFLASKKIDKIDYIINNAGAMVVKQNLRGVDTGISPVLATPTGEFCENSKKQDYIFTPLEDGDNTTSPAFGSIIINNVDHSFTTNHLGHFFITLLMLPYLLKSPVARVVNTTSAIHVGFSQHYSLLNCLMRDEKSWIAPDAYQNTKICNLWFTNQLQRKFSSNFAVCTLPDSNPPVTTPTAYSVHPVMFPLAFFVMKSIYQGCLSTVHCCIGNNKVYFHALEQSVTKSLPSLDVSKDVAEIMSKYDPLRAPQPGQFHSECKVSAQSPAVNDLVRQEELWQLSLLLVRKYINRDNYPLYDYIQ